MVFAGGRERQWRGGRCRLSLAIAFSATQGVGMSRTVSAVTAGLDRRSNAASVCTGASDAEARVLQMGIGRTSTASVPSARQSPCRDPSTDGVWRFGIWQCYYCCRKNKVVGFTATNRSLRISVPLPSHAPGNARHPSNKPPRRTRHLHPSAGEHDRSTCRSDALPRCSGHLGRQRSK